MNNQDPNFSYRNKFTANSGTLNAFLNKGNKHLHAIAILYKKGYPFSELVLNYKHTVNSDIEKLISECLVHLNVYAREASYSK